MSLARTFAAILLGCTMLAGCDSDSDNKPADTSSSKASDTSVSDKGTFDALKAGIAKLEGQQGEWQTALADLKSRMAIAETDLKAFKDMNLGQLQASIAALSDKMNKVEGDITALQKLDERLKTLGDSIAALQTASLTKAELASVTGLEQQIKTLKDDTGKALATRLELTNLAGLTAEIEKLKTTVADKTAFEAANKAISDKLALLEASDKTGATATDELKKRLAKIERDLKQLLPEVREDIAGLTQFVNVFTGTQRTDIAQGAIHSGNVNPGAQTPFGMVSFGPDTTGSGQPWGYGSGGYDYADTSIKNFSMTHLNGPGCRGQGGVAMMPSENTTSFSLAGAPYTHPNEVAEPGFYKVAFNNKIISELTATTRTGMARFSWPDATKAVLVFDAKQSNGMSVTASNASITLSADNKSVSGKSVVGAFCDGTWRKPVYFHATFDKPLKTATSGTSNGATRLHFDLTDADKSVQVKIGISSVSSENAKLNLETENKDLTFEALKAQALAEWNQRLNTIQLDLAKPGELEKLPAPQQAPAKTNLTKFYSAFYRTFSGPTVYSDVNGDYRSMKQVTPFPPTNTVPNRTTENVSGYSFKLDGKDAGYKTHYSGFSMWDTYRSQTQFLALIAPSETSEMMQSLVADAKQCGALPHWVDGSDDTIPMQGDHAPTVVAGSYLFGAKNFDIESMRAFMKQSAFNDASACNDKLSAGRNADMPVLPKYKELGYVPTAFPSSNPWKSGSATIELITTDRSIGAFLKALPTASADATEINSLIVGAEGKAPRASNWTNLFDDNQKKLRGKDAAGVWQTLTDIFHESTEENYIWAFAHDWTALIEKLGGKAAALDRLNKLFVFTNFAGPDPTGNVLNSGEAGKTLYIGNEPAFQTPWAYNWAGSPKHAQYIIPVILNKNFTVRPGGLPGNDDMGATSTWFIWASLGLYPVIPSEAGLSISTPQFSGATVWLGNGKKLRIETDKQALLDDTRYIQQMKLGDAVYAGTWLPLDKIKDGGKLSFTLSKLPTEWGAAPEFAPPSGPNADYSKMTAKPLAGPQLIQ